MIVFPLRAQVFINYISVVQSVNSDLCSTAAPSPWRTSSRCSSGSLQSRCTACRQAASPATGTPPSGYPAWTVLERQQHEQHLRVYPEVHYVLTTADIKSQQGVFDRGLGSEVAGHSFTFQKERWMFTFIDSITQIITTCKNCSLLQCVCVCVCVCVCACVCVCRIPGCCAE